jgi:1-acyl-sn-glycerol-3-phosphate acyltransferase
MELVYPPVIALARTLFTVMRWRVDIQGSEHVPADGPAVIATNHIGYLDFAFIGYGARERGRLVRFMAKQEVFDHRIAGPLMRGMHHLPVDRFGSATEAVRTAVDALDRDQVIGLFPEGTISRSFMPAEAKTGAARIAMRAQAPLIPGVVWGSQRLLTKGRRANWQRHVPIIVAFGAPVAHQHDDDPQAVTDELMGRITGMVERAAADYPDAPAGDDDRWWLPAHLGGTAPSREESVAMADRERRERIARRRAARSAGRDGTGRDTRAS